MNELFFRNKLDVKNIRMNQTIKQTNICPHMDCSHTIRIYEN